MCRGTTVGFISELHIGVQGPLLGSWWTIVIANVLRSSTYGYVLIPESIQSTDVLIVVI